jgi:hypothetical protein
MLSKCFSSSQKPPDLEGGDKAEEMEKAGNKSRRKGGGSP